MRESDEGCKLKYSNQRRSVDKGTFEQRLKEDEAGTFQIKGILGIQKGKHKGLVVKKGKREQGDEVKRRGLEEVT